MLWVDVGEGGRPADFVEQCSTTVGSKPVSDAVFRNTAKAAFRFDVRLGGPVSELTTGWPFA
jgi:hypothetical protein